MFPAPLPVVLPPLIPAIAGGGLLKAMLSLFVMLGIMDPTGSAYVVFNNIGDAALYFLPLLVAVSAANKLKCNHMIVIVAVGALILPKMTTLLTVEGGTVLFGFTLWLAVGMFFFFAVIYNGRNAGKTKKKLVYFNRV